MNTFSALPIRFEVWLVLAWFLGLFVPLCGVGSPQEEWPISSGSWLFQGSEHLFSWRFLVAALLFLLLFTTDDESQKDQPPTSIYWQWMMFHQRWWVESKNHCSLLYFLALVTTYEVADSSWVAKGSALWPERTIFYLWRTFSEQFESFKPFIYNRAKRIAAILAAYFFLLACRTLVYVSLTLLYDQG